MTEDLPRESVEFLAVPINVDGVPVLTGVEVCVVPIGTRPVTWVAPVALAGKIGILVSGYAVGLWSVWARVVDSAPETPVINVGSFRVT